MKSGSADWNRWCGSAVFPTFGSVGFAKKTEKEQQWQAVQMQDRKRKQQAEEEAERYRTSLVKRYKNSPLTREILKTICDGTERNPEEIVIDKSGASGRTDGWCAAMFLAHRVPELTVSKAFSYEYHPIQNLGVTDCVFVRQQAALAEAIREILGEDYSIEHKDDGRIVVMRLKPTKRF